MPADIFDQDYTFMPTEHLLTFEEIERLARIFARLSAEGKLYTCLFAAKGFDLRDLVRSAASDEEIAWAVTEVWNKRKDCYSDERTEETMKNREKIEMSYIGG